ncbi:hypothetical protein BD289DRAFT_107731 [Coniella lustricola]|uniref:FAD-binding domain-containing protein n=1 Tax=Coniella lustricola TaxID=2025994 RepID=A0A2T3AGJ1_9PEZI|nr:hypothetical protein BD289DRAFT_107731 [Coniella lustricola]
MKVLISGVGVAGPALAFWLAKAGAHITIVEKAPSLLSNGQNIDVSGTAIAIIKKMGLMDELRRLNTREKGTRFVNHTGCIFASNPITPGQSTSISSEFEILRGDLAKMLYEPTKSHPNITYLFNTTITEVLSNDEHSVKVKLSNGDEAEFDVLVAADGQWSRIRKQHFPAKDLKLLDTNMYCVYFTMPRLPGDSDWWTVHVAPGSRIVTTRPDSHGTYRGMFTHMPTTAAQKQAWQAAATASISFSEKDNNSNNISNEQYRRKIQQETVKRTFADAGWQTPRLLAGMSEAQDFYFQTIQQIRMARWSNNRIVLVGDAAYCPTPLTGAGATLAIEGAYVLAGELSRLRDGEHPVRAFEAYDEVFRPWVDTKQMFWQWAANAAHPKTGLGLWILQAALWVICKLVKVAWVVKLSGADASDEVEDFKVPHYPKFDECEERKY